MALLKPLVTRYGRASRAEAAASYLLASTLFDGGWYVQALAEATALQRELDRRSPAATEENTVAGKDTVAGDGAASATELSVLINDLRPRAAEEERLTVLAARRQDPAAALCARADLAAWRVHPEEAAALYGAAFAALKTDHVAIPATRLRVDQGYLDSVMRRPSSRRTVLVPLTLHLLTAEGLSRGERRLGLMAEAHLLGQTPAAVADADLDAASHEAAAELVGMRPALSSSFLGQFVMALCRDARGGIWAGTEDQGVWHFDPHPDAKARQGHWGQFTAENTGGGLGDNAIYALCSDRQGRIWAGTVRHGVSVFNGRIWRSYGLREGLAGSRVFTLACCPVTGDTWVATEGGLSRYVSSEDRWMTYSRLDGLPSDTINSLAFGKDGTVYAGTLADGIAIASSAGGYGHWHTVPGPPGVPKATGGVGLPSTSVNCLLSARDGMIYAGTDDGLARSGDGGQHWRFLRGKNAPARIRDIYTGRVDAAMVSGVEILSGPDVEANPCVAVAAGRSRADGGGFTDYFSADDDPSAGSFTGGTVQASADRVDVGDPATAAPEAMYQNARYGNFTYTSPPLVKSRTYWVHLDFAEALHDGPGQRVFDVFANGAHALTGFDAFTAAGGRNRAVTREFPVRADKAGRIMLRFQGADADPVTVNPYALQEDYVTCLAEDGAGHLWVGHRQAGVEVLDPASGESLYPGPNAAPPVDNVHLADEVVAVLPDDGGALISGYGFGPGGLQDLQLWPSHQEVGVQEANMSGAANTPVASVPPLPSAAGTPTLAELNALLRTASTVPPDPQETAPHMTALEDDWATEGDWLGRYGRYWACLCALCSPSDYVWGAGWEPVNYASLQGPGHDPGDSLRYWVQWLYTSDPRVLELPPTYLDSRIKKGLTDGSQPRREAEQDDHGEAYSDDADGLGVYETVTVPSGLYVLSLYNMNKDGHESSNRFRDYRLSVRPHPEGQRLDDLTGFQDTPEWAHGRVTQFWYGVWKRFLVRGPVTLTVEVNRNHSLNAILPAVMLDLVDELPPPYFGTVASWQAGQVQQTRERAHLGAAWRRSGSPGTFDPAATAPTAAAHLMAALDRARLVNSSWWAVNGRRFYGPLLRWYASQLREGRSAPYLPCLTTCYYQMGLYPQWEECQKRAGLTPARDIEKSLRWDGISDAGQGYQVVTSYLATRRGNQISQKL
ncbi:MAG: two-component regulator propeller domain-containing protein [Janthinobacterium lividum]